MCFSSGRDNWVASPKSAIFFGRTSQPSELFSRRGSLHATTTYNVHVSRQEQVGQRQISVEYVVRVQVEQSLDHLRHHFASFLFVQGVTGRFEIVLQLSVVAQFQDEVDEIGVFEEGVELQDRRVAESRMDAHFLTDTIHHTRSLHQFFINL